MRKGLLNIALAEAERHLADDPSHGLTHITNMLKIADYLVKKEKLTGKIDLESLKLAIIFHDFGRIGHLTDKNIDDHDILSSKLALNFLKKQKYSRAQKVADIILHHDRKIMANTLEDKIFYDADILDVLGAVGISRTFTYGGQIGRDLNGSMKRLFWKSFRDQPTTKTAKKLASSRRKFIRDFIKQYQKEIKLID